MLVTLEAALTRTMKQVIKMNEKSFCEMTKDERLEEWAHYMRLARDARADGLNVTAYYLEEYAQKILDYGKA